MKPMTTSFYPDSVEKRYVYLTSLQLEEGSRPQEVYQEAVSEIQSARSNFLSGGAWSEAYSNLSALIATERQAEQGFLASNLKGVNLEQVKGYGFKEMIDAFNRILGFETTYRTNLERVLAMDLAGDGGTGQIDRLYALLNYSLPDALEKALVAVLGDNPENIDKLTSGQFDDDLLQQCAEAVKQEVIKVYGENGSAAAEYVEFSSLMQRLLNEGPFVTQLMQAYGASPQQLRQQLTKVQEKVGSGKRASDVQPKDLMLQRQGGNVFEIFVEQVLQEIAPAIQGKAMSTGKLNNMKADHIISIGVDNLETRLKQLVGAQSGQGEASIRVKNIEALKAFFQDVRETTGSIIFISDKNYRLNSQAFASQKGFAAETPTFDVLEKVLSRAMTNDMSDLEDLIFVLANTGPGRINESKEEIERYLATKIGSFVFDDVVITDELNNNASSISRIHVFNLGNIYIPLSVFLQAVYDALRQMNNDFTNYVNVHISPAKISYKEQIDGLTQSDWEQLYQDTVTSGHVAFHFFGNFVQFVSQYLRQS